MQVMTSMASEAQNVAQDTQHITVPVWLIRSGIQVVVKIASTVSGSIRSIPNRAFTHGDIFPPPSPRDISLLSHYSDQDYGGAFDRTSSFPSPQGLEY